MNDSDDDLVSHLEPLASFHMLCFYLKVCESFCKEFQFVCE